MDPERARRIIAPSGRGRQIVRDNSLVVGIRGAITCVPVDGEFSSAGGDVHLLSVGTLVNKDTLIGRRGRESELRADWTVVYEPPLLATCTHPDGGLVRLTASPSDALLRSNATTFIMTDLYIQAVYTCPRL